MTVAERLPQPMLGIGSARTCDCPPNHINCLTAKEWMKSQVGVWRFAYNGKDVRKKVSTRLRFP